MSNNLKEVVASTGKIPLSWVGQSAKQSYFNLGDALSPLIVSFLSGLPVKHVATKSTTTRLAAVGTIGHMFEGGDVTFWGTGTSPHLNPHDPPEEKILYSRPRDTRMTVHATRGPFTREVFGLESQNGPAIYGDPLWLLPRFHEAPREKTHELGVILHLSELRGRDYTKEIEAEHVRYHLDPGEEASIKLISTVTAPTTAALRERLDDILSCKRIISTSLHGMVFAESYGIPCLYFSPRATSPGIGKVDFSERDAIDLRFNDLYRGLGYSSLDVFYQPRLQKTDWDSVISAIDRVWFEKTLNDDALIGAFPLDVAPMSKGSSGSTFDHPSLKKLIPPKPEPSTGLASSVLKRVMSHFR